MTLYEFRQKTNDQVTPSEFEIIEAVYTFHPSIKNVEGKDQCATLYNNFGFRIFLDMHHAALRMRDMEYALQKKQIEVEAIKAAIEDFAKGVR